ncbi:MAG: transcriptional regulator TetR family [Mycobacterium sp.]|nr:transcriptional regulator TetR family [Mycobacterium sp.]
MVDRPLRADARQNRERLIDAATKAFTANGSNTSLEEVARTAGVGVGTLYRHFPTREALYVAVHRAEIVRVARRAHELLETHPPLDALRLWLDEFIEFFEAKKGMAQIFRSVMARGENPFIDLRVLTYEAAQSLLKTAAHDGVRQDVDAADLIASVYGISLAATDAEQSGRLLELLLHGLRAQPH